MLTFFPTRAIALSIGVFSIHWYGLLYALAFLLGIWLLPRLLRFRSLALSQQQRESLLMHVFLGVILGGRIGYVVFYGLSYYLAHPLHIVAVWEGGMSSHGGFIGVTLSLLYFSHKNKCSPLVLADVLMVPVAIGLALGRLGNLLNAELYGTVTTLPWGMYFSGVDGLRHPTQMYAMMKDIAIALLCFSHLRYTQKMPIAGRTTSYFLLLYAVLRFFVEVFRDQPFGFVSFGFLHLSWGQIYTLPVFVIGFFLWIYSGSVHRRKRG